MPPLPNFSEPPFSHLQNCRDLRHCVTRPRPPASPEVPINFTSPKPTVTWHLDLNGTARQAGRPAHSHGKAPQLSGTGSVLRPLAQGMPCLTLELLKRPHRKGAYTRTGLERVLAAQEGHGCPGSQTGQSTRTSPSSTKLPMTAGRNPLQSQNSRLCPFSPPNEPPGSLGHLLERCPWREGALPSLLPLGEASRPQAG